MAMPSVLLARLAARLLGVLFRLALGERSGWSFGGAFRFVEPLLQRADGLLEHRDVLTQLLIFQNQLLIRRRVHANLDSDVARQLYAIIGIGRRPGKLTLNKHNGFLWEHLDRGAIEKAWNSYDCRHLVKDGWPSPLATFDFLKASRAKHWATCRNCTHGDLNTTNVAIDASLPDNPQAYIIDAAGMKGDFDFRDLATLEVTTVLFNSVGIDEQLMQVCRPFYENDFLPTGAPDSASTSQFTQNVFAMIAAIRSCFESKQQKTAYALLVFDAALRQLFGLGIQPSPNKIRNPLHACYLAAWVSKWLKNVAPELFAAPVQPDTSVAKLEPA